MVEEDFAVDALELEIALLETGEQFVLLGVGQLGEALAREGGPAMAVERGQRRAVERSRGHRDCEPCWGVPSLEWPAHVEPLRAAERPGELGDR